MSRAIRVLHCIHSLRGGGAERQLDLLARYSSDPDVQHAVFCVSRAGLGPEDAAMPVYQAAKSSRWNWRLWADLRHVMHEYQPHVVQAWLPASMTIPALINARRFGSRTIFCYRNQMRFHRPVAIPEWLVALLYSDRVVSNTPVEACTRPFRFLYRLKRGRYVPNGVVLGNVMTKSTHQIVPPAPLHVLFVGRLVRDKNPECLLRALAAIDEFPWQLTICGRGHEEARLRELARSLGLKARVQWLGFRDDVGQIMAAHDVLVLPSWREGSPNVALEAMAIGLPCILSSIPGNVALFGTSNAALLIDPRSAEDLAGALRRIRSDADLRARLASCAKAFVHEFRPEQTARSYTQLYREMLSGAA